MKQPISATFAFSLLALAASLSLPGCAYRLDGKVVDGFSGVSIGRADDPDARKSGIGGATVENDLARTAREATVDDGPEDRFLDGDAAERRRAVALAAERLAVLADHACKHLHVADRIGDAGNLQHFVAQ